MGDEVITLIKNDVINSDGEYETDENGNAVCATLETEVYATRKSIQSKEFHDASLTGLKPELMYEIWDFEYKGEDKVRVGDVIYHVYRTYQKDDKRELYLTQRNGDNEQYQC